MAGSRSNDGYAPYDPVLTARIDAISQLAEGLSDRIAIIDSQFNILYANCAASQEQPIKTVSPSQPDKCFHVFAHQTDPCEGCPAMQVFDGSRGRNVAYESEGETPCGMQRALPLVATDGHPVSMVVQLNEQIRTGRRRDGKAPKAPAGATVRDQLGDLIGKSVPMQQLFEMVALVADSSATVLIQGESGTGKELVAKTIHQLSGRREKPFVVIDCGSLPETLLESELFGHVKGAFTGAVTHKPGLFEEANGGTIFLDEIADTTPLFQAKLLRVLQEGEIKRVGGTHPMKVNVRIISATNKDLADLVQTKRFRQDLYYRLAVLPLSVPPLRERREDIALLVEHFIQQSCARHRQPRRTVSADVLNALTEAPWPGNVRELQHCIERAVVTTQGSIVSCSVVGANRSESGALDLRSVSKNAQKQAEKARIMQALKESCGRRAQAAKSLKISRAGLYNKLHEYGLT